MTMGLRQYARHRKAKGLAGGTLKAVQVAIESGRLATSVTRDGRISGAAAADREWASNTLEDRVPMTGPTAASSPGPTPMQNHRARRAAADAELTEIALAEKRRSLVSAKNVDARLADVFARCRARLHAIVAHARQRDASLTTEQLALLDALIHEATEDLA